MTSSVANAGFNLALLPIAERQAIEKHKQECLERYHQAKSIAKEIYSGLDANGRIWAEREIAKHPEIDQAIRAELNALMRKKRK